MSLVLRKDDESTTQKQRKEENATMLITPMTLQGTVVLSKSNFRISQSHSKGGENCE